jgi:hypothetical protein
MSKQDEKKIAVRRSAIVKCLKEISLNNFEIERIADHIMNNRERIVALLRPICIPIGVEDASDY